MHLMKKIVDNEELTKCMKGDPVIYVCCSKDLKLLRTKKCTERNNFCTGKRCTLCQHKQGKYCQN